MAAKRYFVVVALVLTSAGAIWLGISCAADADPNMKGVAAVLTALIVGTFVFMALHILRPGSIADRIAIAPYVLLHVAARLLGMCLGFALIFAIAIVAATALIALPVAALAGIGYFLYRDWMFLIPPFAAVLVLWMYVSALERHRKSPNRN